MAARIVLILRWIAVAVMVLAVLLIMVRRKIPPARPSRSQSGPDWWREMWRRWMESREDARERSLNIAALRGRKALIVDPDPKSARVLAWRFQKLKCGVTRARNGAQAIARAREHEPDLIIADALLPDMMASEFYYGLPTRELPVVFVGVPAGQWDELRSLSHLIGCLSRPFDPEDAASLAGAMLRRMQG